MTRRHDIDALRALAFALLILYHLCMLYVSDWEWVLKSSYLAEWLQWPMLVVNRWRMDLIFLISGIAAAFVLKPSRLDAFLGTRSLRLLIPLIFGMFVVVPIQPYVQGVVDGVVEPGFITFLGDYYRGGAWPEESFDGADGVTWSHLWYLAYLWLYTLVLGAIAKPLASPLGERMRNRFTALRGWALLIWPALPLLIYTLTLQERFPPESDLEQDWYRHAVYFTVFLYGYLIARDAGFWAEALRLRWMALGTAILMGTAYLLSLALLPEQINTPSESIPFGMQTLIWTFRNLYVWSALLAILGWSHRYLNRPFRWLSWTNEAVYPWYLLHQSVTVAVAYWLVPLELGAVWEASGVLAGTVLGCWAIFAVVRRLRWLRPLFGLKASGGPTPVAIDPRSSAAY